MIDALLPLWPAAVLYWAAVLILRGSGDLARPWLARADLPPSAPVPTGHPMARHVARLSRRLIRGVWLLGLAASCSVAVLADERAARGVFVLATLIAWVDLVVLIAVMLAAAISVARGGS